MITPAYAARMARYAAWQNRSLAEAADTLDDAARRLDRGAFFGSVQGTLNHLLWADRIWMHRLAGHETPAAASIGDSVRETPDWQAYRAARADKDAAISAWAEGLTEADLAGELTWFSAATNNEQRHLRALLVVHLFNHQTHHRGQVHAMLTAAGARPQATDLPFQPAGA